MTTNRRKFFLGIRHKPSGGMLPNVRGYGFTKTEPELDEPPRLFVRRSSAAQALNYWLEGEHIESNPDNDFSGEIKLRVIPKPHRRREDMEIVEIEIVVRSLTEAQLRSL